MMPLVHACVMPHGALVLDPTKAADDAERGVCGDGGASLHMACADTAAGLADATPELIVLTTPHGMALPGAVAVYTHETIQGTAEWMDEWQGFTVAGEGDAAAAYSLLAHLKASDFNAEPVTGPGMYAPLRWGEAVRPRRSRVRNSFFTVSRK